MSTQNDLLDGNDSNLERLSNEAPEQSDMCLNWQDDVDNNFPNCEPDACGDYCVDTTSRYVEILYFKHYFKHITFSSKGHKIRNKEINNYIEVSVVIDIECGDTRSGN